MAKHPKAHKTMNYNDHWYLINLKSFLLYFLSLYYNYYEKKPRTNNAINQTNMYQNKHLETIFREFK